VHYYYDRQGRPISNDQWMALFALKNRTVAYTDLGRMGRVSTVWIGLNHAYHDGPPEIFETLVFDGPEDGNMFRYATEQQARDGHQFMVMMLTTLREPVKYPPLIHNGKKPRKKWKQHG
jgi:hypothetical protein